MTSPSAEVLARRRYHKQASKRSKDRHNRHRKGSPKKAAPLGITNKRLTIKNGFTFKGALQTSPQFRGAKGNAMKKSTKRSAEFDLQCLLKAAKRGESSECQTMSASLSSETSDGPSNFTEFNTHNKERDEEHYVHRLTKPLPKVVVNPPGSSKNNLSRSRSISDKDTLEIEDILKTVKHSKSNHQYKENQRDILNHHDPTSFEDYNTRHNASSENSVPQAKVRQRSTISLYQKFALSIVEGLSAEKKKLYPTREGGLLEDISNELNDIYTKTRHISNMICQIPATMAETTKHAELNQMNVQFQAPCKPNTKPLPNDQNCKYLPEEKTFKEKCVEAWVNAIPAGSSEDKLVLQATNRVRGKLKATYRETEKEFLRNVGRIPTCKAPYSHPFDVGHSYLGTGQKTSAMKGSPHIPPTVHGGGHERNFLRSKPSFSFFPARENQPIIVIGKESESKERHDPWNFKTGLGLPPTLPKEKHQQSWNFWSKDSKNNRSTERFECLSPIEEPLLFMREHHRGKVNENAKQPANNPADNSSIWNHFPKLFKEGKGESTHHRAKIPNNIERRKYDNKEKHSPAETFLMKFSPRKMF